MTFLLKIKSDYLTKISIVLGLALLLSTVFFDQIYNFLFLFSFFELFIIGFVLLLAIIISLLKKNWKTAILGLVLMGFSITCFLMDGVDWEFCRAPTKLEALLIDDLSSIHLRLRNDNSFLTTSQGMFGFTWKFKGKYKLDGNKIVFLSRPYDNDFIPDTVSIVDDKIILKFDKNGRPCTEQATFFQILKEPWKKPLFGVSKK
jgi:hypothetical protein